MPFEVRIGASKYDHGNEGLRVFHRIEQIAREFGFSAWLRESTIVSLLETYGEKKEEWGLRALHGRGNWSLGTLVKIIEGKVPPEHTAPAQQSRTAPQSERTSGGPRTVADFMQQHGVKLPK